MKGLKGEPNLMELRPRQRGSAARLIFARVENGYKILAVACNKDEFQAAVRHARERADFRYRSDSGLSQRALAERLGTRQPQVARLESGEHNPRFETLVNIVRVTGIEFCIDFVPEGRESKLTSKRAQQQAGSRSLQGGVSVIAASA